MTIKNNPILFTLFLLSILLTGCSENQIPFIDLSGEWEFRIDPDDEGISAGWFNTSFNEKVTLPGSMLTNGKGYDVTAETKWTGGIWDSTWFHHPDFAKYREPGNVKVAFWLQPLKYYAGPAWYRRKVVIPDKWKDSHTELFLERCHWESTVWVDDQPAGMQNALSAPHSYDLSQWLTPGEHTITIRVDNRIKDIDPGRDAHSVSDNTQTNWNGMIGKIGLINRPAIYISDIRLFPDIKNKTVRAFIAINNQKGTEIKCNLKIRAKLVYGNKGERLKPLVREVVASSDTTQVMLDYDMGNAPALWSEFDPNVYSFEAVLESPAGSDKSNVDFGMREFVVSGKRFSVNGQVVFLRGTLECAIFPKTGYPSVNVGDWMHIYGKCKEYGLNHVRFHSWCPPEAAFIAADRMGIYLSVENSAWAHIGDGTPIDQYIYDESNRIVKNFGNHPSFCMMPYGNEASGDSAVQYLTKFIGYWQKKDSRRLYTSGSGFPQSPASDYTSSGAPRIQWWEAGLNSPINANPPTTDFDWTQYLDTAKPTVSHEIGQWCVYPDFKEMSLYEGVLKPKNFEIFKEKLEEHGMGHLADSFLLASGKLQVLCYKADIEAAFRTPDFAGFQLLDLHDFPGQGTALVGVLNAFWEDKSYVTAKEYRRFCNTTVPLLRMKKMIWLNNEIFTARAEIAHFGQNALENTVLWWKIFDEHGNVGASGEFPDSRVDIGLTAPLGEIIHPLSDIKQPAKLTVTVGAGVIENSWDFWVYPESVPEIPGEKEILVTSDLNPATIKYLKQGGKVLLTVKKGSVVPDKGGNVPVGFSSIFWNTQWTAFRQPPFTLGILCNPSHPALSEFPSEYHSNWQWWDAMSHCNAIRLDSISTDIQPIVRIIDDWFTARPLGLIFECRIGTGKLIVSGVDLISNLDDRPEARQLLFSLKKYMAGNSFNPVVAVEPEKIISLVN
ncbi:MAG TPA: beta-galactosidase [Bacteroidales bacterium]|jgi:hypothetical protein|nr:beta-galactosidase [Bacteroidales bacterium]